MDLFPTLLEEYDLTGAPGVDAFEEHILKGIKDNMHRGHSLAVNGVSSHGGFDPLNDPASREILAVFQECVNHYSDKMGTYPSMMSGAWYNVLPKGGYTERHRHESSVVSGAFYIKLPEGDCGNFYVVSPLQQYMMCMQFVKKSLYGDYFFDVPIKESHLYLFPSWLEHGSRVNNTDDDRITVSFNTTPVPKDDLPADFIEQIWGNDNENS